MPVEFMTEHGEQYTTYPESEPISAPIQTPLPLIQRPLPVKERRQTPRPFEIKNMKWKG